MSAESPFDKAAGQRFECHTCQVSAETAPGETFTPTFETLVFKAHKGHDCRVEGGDE